MSTFSTDLKIELIGTGEQSGVWGTTTNSNFSNVFEQALVGRVQVAFTDADVTLTATDTVNSQSFRRLYLNCTGANTANKNLIVPTINKTYVVQNNTTGGYDIVIKTSAGTGITVTNGKTAAVYVDGTNVIQAFDYIPSVTIGTLTTTGAVTFSATTQNLALGTSQTSGTWTAGGAAQTGTITLDQSTKAHTLNIGTGATENATTKTINLGTAGVSGSTTTINIGSAVSGATNSITINGNPTFSGGTANGVIYLNGSKVATTGSAITFDGTNFATTGTASATKLIPTGGAVTGNGMYLPAANAVAITTNGANAIYIDSSQNVGIGTSSPILGGWTGTNPRLTVSSNTNTPITFAGFETAAAGPVVQFVKARGTQASPTATSSGDDLGAISFAGYNTGNTLAQAAGILVEQDGAGGATYIPSRITFQTGTNAATPTERMRIDSSGNVGLGVTPSAWDSGYKFFETQGGSFGTASATRISLFQNAYVNGGVYKYKTTAAASWYYQDSGSHWWASASSGTAGNTITWTTVLNLDKGKTLALEGATSQTGTGITFPATQSASTDANTLDDYEEGTHTATITCGTSGTITLYSQFSALAYTKIGRSVTITGNISVLSVSSPVGYFTISLPFTIANLSEQSGRFAGGIIVSGTVAANVADFVLFGEEAQSTVYVYLGDATTTQSDSAQEIKAGTEIILGFTYFTD